MSKCRTSFAVDRLAGLGGWMVGKRKESDFGGRVSGTSDPILIFGKYGQIEERFDHLFQTLASETERRGTVVCVDR
jgi:hypothetical protein